MSLACVGSAHSVPATLGLPPLDACVLSPSTLLRLQVALQGVGPELHAVPVFGYSTKAQTRLGCVLCLPRPSSSGSQELDGCTLRGCGAPSPLRGPSLSFRAPVGCVRLASILESWPLTSTLLADVDHPESQEVFG